MASLAQYSAALHDAPAAHRPAPGRATRWFGIALYVVAGALVLAAAVQSA